MDPVEVEAATTVPAEVEVATMDPVVDPVVDPVAVPVAEALIQEVGAQEEAEVASIQVAAAKVVLVREEEAQVAVALTRVVAVRGVEEVRLVGEVVALSFH